MAGIGRTMCSSRIIEVLSALERAIFSVELTEKKKETTRELDPGQGGPGQGGNRSGGEREKRKCFLDQVGDLGG